MPFFSLHHFHHQVDPTLYAALARIEAKLDAVLSMEKRMFDALIAEVARQTTADDSVVALINQLAANSGDPVKLATLVSQMKANTDKVVAAVTANTPAAA